MTEANDAAARAPSPTVTPRQRRARARRLAIALGVTAALGGAITVGTSLASDHQDTPEVEFNPQFDVNDVYAFPAATPGRIALVLGTSSPITPAQTPTRAFGNRQEVLYQLKVDNTGDAVEDLVFQLTFTGPAHNQKVTLHGPVAPSVTGTSNALMRGKPTLVGRTNTVLGSPDGIQLFAGPRDDPFFLDLEQFFRIIPDRKPEGGPLAQLPEDPSASSFRAEGAAVDFLRGINDLAIVIELPASMLTDGGAHPRFGVWGTTSRARKPGAR
jgi:hypothetical protein